MSKDYPKWLYRKTGSILIQDKVAQDALEGNWFESPADIVETLDEIAYSPDRNELLAMAEELGIKVDKRWSDARIKQEIDKE